MGHTDATYHAHHAISNTKLKVFRKSRALYRAMFVEELIRQTTTPAMLAGSVLHCLVLEPHLFTDRYAVAPKVDRRTKEGKATWTDFCINAGDREVVDADTYQQAQRMANAIASNSAAAKLVDQMGIAEYPIFWRHRVADIDCRAKLDKAILSSDLILDIKSCQDATPSGFAKSIVNFGYDYQNAWYSDGYQAVHDVWPNFLFIAVQSEEPHEVGIYEINHSDLQYARDANDEAALQLADCLRTNNWVQEHERDVVKLTLPGYAKFRDVYSY